MIFNSPLSENTGQQHNRSWPRFVYEVASAPDLCRSFKLQMCSPAVVIATYPARINGEARWLAIAKELQRCSLPSRLISRLGCRSRPRSLPRCEISLSAAFSRAGRAFLPPGSWLVSWVLPDAPSYLLTKSSLPKGISRQGGQRRRL